MIKKENCQGKTKSGNRCKKPEVILNLCITHYKLKMGLDQERKRYKKPCRKCEEFFIPQTKHSRVCDLCKLTTRQRLRGFFYE
jgi:hypothetical protein